MSALSLPSQLHDLKLSLNAFKLGLLSAEDEAKISQLAAKLTALLDACSARDHSDNKESEDAGETLLTIAQQYGVKVADLRLHNPHLQHYEDNEPLPRNTPVKIKAPKKRGSVAPIEDSKSQSRIAVVPRDAPLPNDVPLRAQRGRFAFDTIRSIAKEQNVSMRSLIAANRILEKFDVDEPLPQDLDIEIPVNAEPAQRTYVLTFAGETLRIVAEAVARCRIEDLIAVNPQLGNIGPDSRLPEGTRIALPR
jgi:LysM repeat protein